MPDAIVVTLDPPKASVKPGQETLIGVTIHNDSEEVETYELSLEGPDDVLGWVELQPKERAVSAFLQQDGRAKVVLRLPAGAPRGPSFFSVRAVSRRSASVQTVVRFNFDVDAPPPPVDEPPTAGPEIAPTTTPATAPAIRPTGVTPDGHPGAAIEVTAEELVDPSLPPTAGRWRLRLRNTGPSTGTFGLSVLDGSPRMVTVEPPEVKLGPGETASAVLMVRLSEETPVGSKSLVLRTYSFGDPEKQAEMPLALLVRRSTVPVPVLPMGSPVTEGPVAITVDQDRFAVEPGTGRRVRLLIENLGDQPLTLELQVKGALPTWFSPESTSVIVPAGRIATVEVGFAVPEDTPGGAYPLIIRGQASQNAASFRVALLLAVNAPPPASPISLIVKADSSVDDRLRTAPGSPVHAMVTIKNSTNKETNVELQLSGLERSWVRIDRPKVMVFGFTTQIVNVWITPSDDLTRALAGVYPILIKGQSQELSDKVGDARMELEVQVVGEQEITLGENTTPSARKASYPLWVRNQTNAPITLDFSASDSAGALLYLFDPPELTVQPGDRKQVNLTVRARQLAAQARTIEFKVVAAGEYALVEGLHLDAGRRELTGRYSQAVAPAVNLAVSPRSIEGTDRGDYQIRLNNPGGAPMTVRLTASDEAQGLNFEFSPAEVTLAAGEERVAKLVASTKERVKAGQGRDFAFTVTATPAPQNDALPASDKAALKILRPHWWEGIVAVLQVIRGWLAAVIRFLRERSRWKYLLAALVCLAVIALAYWLVERVDREGIVGVPVAGPIVAAVETRVAPAVIPTPTSSPVPTTAPAPTSAPTPTGAPQPTQAPAASTSVPTPAGAAGALDKQVSTDFHALPTPASAVFVDLNGTTRVDLNSTTEVPAASTAKLPVMIAVWRQLNDGKLKPTDVLTVTQDKIVDGTGILQNQLGHSLSVEELLEVTILNSDNTGANMLIDKIGGLDQVNATLKSVGFTHTHLGRHFMDTEALKKGLDNTMSPGDMAQMLEMIYRGQLISKEASADMHRILLLRGQKTDAGLDYLGRLLVPRPPIAHVNGVLTGIHNDGGIIEPPSGAFIIVIFLSNQVNEAAAETAIAKTSADIYAAVTQAR